MKKWRRSLWIKMLVCVLVANVCCVSNISGVVKKANADTTTESGSGDTHGFIKVNGDKMYDENGQEYRIKSMGMGNDVWSNPKNPIITYANENSYKELSELGFNGVRYYINYKLFVSDDSDTSGNFVWNEAGFAWLSQNIAWAKKYDMKVLINMHVPAGGFMMAQNASLWTPQIPGYNVSYPNLFKTKILWNEIARRYCDETAVIGYGLLNEPFLAGKITDGNDPNTIYTNKTKDEALDQYYDYIDELKDTIRSVDNNHILFVERPYGCISGTYSYSASGEVKSYKCSYWDNGESQRLINDSNVVYEMHFYEPNNLTHTGLIYKNILDSNDNVIGYKYKHEKDYIYNDSTAIPRGDRWYDSDKFIELSSAYNTQNSEWQKIETVLYTSESKANHGYWKLKVSDINSDGIILVDDIVISEYDENGNYLRDVNKYTFSNEYAYFNALDTNKNSINAARYNGDDGYNDNGCLNIGGFTSNDEIRISKNDPIYFVIEQGHSYKISAYVKFNNCDSNVKLNFGYQPIWASNLRKLNKDHLETEMNILLKFGEDNNVPMYVGEFGSSNKTITYNNADNYLRDVMDIFNEKELSYSFHDYHDENWGFYQDNMYVDYTETNRNPKTYEVFKEKVNYESEPEITELPAPVVKATSNKNKKVTLTWDAVPGATSYQLYKYYASSGTIQKSTVVTGTTYTFNGLKKGSTYRYIVQAIGDNALSNNVDGKFAVDARVGVNNDAVIADAAYDADANSLTLSWDKVSGVSEYYVYKYYASTKQLSAPKTTTKNACKYYSVKNGKVNRYLVTTKKIDDLTNYDGRGCISVYVP